MGFVLWTISANKLNDCCPRGHQLPEVSQVSRMSASSHAAHKKTPSRAALPRRTTRGPLDEEEDPLSASSTFSPGSLRSPTTSTPLEKSQDIDAFQRSTSDTINLLSDQQAPDTDAVVEKNLSFLLDPAIYHPLSQVDIPPPLRKPLPGPPPPSASTSKVIEQLGALVEQCDFIGAAHFAVLCLTSNIILPTDHESIFKLLSVRYSCLELTGHVLLAAQEAKALEDLSSDFYYVVPQMSEVDIDTHDGPKPIAKHIMPWSLRVQAVRLQSIGFSDPRRGITALYDIGLEARENISSPYISEEERDRWIRCLESLSTHVVNALIELGDTECAQRTLLRSKPSEVAAQSRWTQRMVLILIKLGQIKKAQGYIDALQSDDHARIICQSILAIADDKLEAAADMLESATNDNTLADIHTLAKQNLAVAYLYLGRIEEARGILADLARDEDSFHTLVVNLATVYDLTSDRSRDLKLQLVNKLATTPRNRTFTNADFKL